MLPFAQGVPTQGTTAPTLIAQAGHARDCEALLMKHVGYVLHRLDTGRWVPDGEILQIADELTTLHQLAYARYEVTRDEEDRNQSYRCLLVRNSVRGRLCSAGYFIDEGDKARARIAGGTTR